MVQKQFIQIENESRLKVASTYECNYVGYNHETLLIIQCGDTTRNNWFYRLCQNKYIISEYSNEFDKIHDVNIRCKQGVHKMMKTFVIVLIR